ncbi:glutamate--tRNA ligase [Candidatus Undinarchaeota archaeon]
MTLEKEIRIAALKNAVLHKGNANHGAVIGYILAGNPEIRKNSGAVVPDIQRIVKEINNIPIENQKKELASLGVTFEKKVEEKKGLPELENPKNIRMRFAPSPSGPLHIGHARTILLNDAYVKKYKGKFILRFEDTDPNNIYPDAYDLIPKEIEWLGVKIHETHYQSDHMDNYYKRAKKLLEDDHLYVCTCESPKHKALLDKFKPCPCRPNSVEENLERWQKMFDDYQPGDAVVRAKTDLKNKNPALRDFPLIRIVDSEHPRIGDKYRVWPLYNFCCAIDDHDLKISHILRGKDHLTNTERQEFLFDWLGWAKPWYFHHGRLKIGDLELSKTKTKKKIADGEYSGWDDARLGTIKALDARGIRPDAIRSTMLDMGMKPVDVNLSWKTLFNYNRQIIEENANRYFFVPNPTKLEIDYEDTTEISLPVHPNYKERGSRLFHLEPKDSKLTLYISKDDYTELEKSPLRLMNLFNVELEAKNKAKAGIGEKLPNKIQWLPNGIDVKLQTPEGEISGIGEDGLQELNEGDIIQFVRVGYVRLFKKEKDLLIFRLTHP